MTYPPHSPWLDLPNDIWGWVQIMKLLVINEYQILMCCFNINLSLDSLYNLEEIENVITGSDTQTYIHPEIFKEILI
jgi:hypothetical protein